jgi:hypothetical protein
MMRLRPVPLMNWSLESVVCSAIVIDPVATPVRLMGMVWAVPA